MFLKIDDLGEKTINKLAEFALSAQFEGADKFKVNVKTDANKLAKGVLESLAIDGQGVFLNNSLRVQELKMTFNTIAVSPLKALMGNIQLTQPSQGNACIVLTEADLESAFTNQAVKQRLQNVQIFLDGQTVTLNCDRVNCRIFADGKIALIGKVYWREIGESREVCLAVKPYINSQGKVILEEIQLLREEENAIAPILLTEIEKILSLNYLQIDGIDLQLERLSIEERQLTIQAAAGLSRFPSA